MDKPLKRPSRTALRAALAPGARRLLDAVILAASDSGVESWAVGGAVRDCAAGLPVRDLDVSVAAADMAGVLALARSVARRTGGVARVSAADLGTATVTTTDAAVDLAALRDERYARPGALPTATLGASLDADLARRDFTVNAVALGLTGPRAGALVDPFDGLADLAARRLRALHARSYVDDATRLWRGARVAAQHRLRPDAADAALIAAGARWLAPISGERLFAEFRLTAARRTFRSALRLLDRWGTLAGVHPAFALAPATDRALGRHPGPHAPEVAAALVLAPLDGRDAVLDRLRPPRAVRAAVDGAARLLVAGAAPPRDAPADADRLAPLATTPPAARDAARWLAPAAQAALQRDLRRWERTAPHLDAAALLALGVPAGPELGRLLACLRRERYLGNLSGVAQARDLVRDELRRAAGRTTRR